MLESANTVYQVWYFVNEAALFMFLAFNILFV